MVDGNVQVVYWSLNKTSVHALSDLDLSKLNVCVVTTYKIVKDDEILAFLVQSSNEFLMMMNTSFWQ